MTLDFSEEHKDQISKFEADEWRRAFVSDVGTE